MTHTLLLRLAGPLQAWGTQSRFSIRDTGQEPSKSGVIGLLCAALGAPRADTATVQRLAAMPFGVRVEREGVMKKDFHTAQNVAIAKGGTKDTEISDRWYLSDAEFLAALESEDVDWLHTLQAALQAPRWQLSLGRKAFVPAAPVWLPDGLRAGSLDDTLRRDYAWQSTRSWRKPDEKPPSQLRLVTDATPETATEVRQDVPLSFAERRFAVRYVRTEFIAPPTATEAGPDASLSHTQGGA